MNGARPPSFVVSQIGARRHYLVPRALHGEGLLEHLYTDICGTRGWPALLAAAPAALRPGPLRRLVGRRPEGIPAERITVFPGFALKAALLRRRARNQAELLETYAWAGAAFSERVIECGFGAARGLYAFRGAALEQLGAARRQGLLTVLDQTIAPQDVLDAQMAQETRRFPHWSPADGTVIASHAAFAARERAEWAVADVIVCGSDYVRQSIARCGGPGDRCVVIPYGLGNWAEPVDRQGRTGPLRVLTVGEVGLRKGSPYVLEAARRLAGKATFRMVGPCNLGPEVRRDLAEAVELTGAVPRDAIRAHYAWADVFLLPSLCEGSAASTYEAMTTGLPVVCTPNTGSIVRPGIDGILVPERDTDAIVDALETLAADPGLRTRMGRFAAGAARQHTETSYGQALAEALSSLPAERTVA